MDREEVLQCNVFLLLMVVSYNLCEGFYVKNIMEDNATDYALEERYFRTCYFFLAVVLVGKPDFYRRVLVSV